MKKLIALSFSLIPTILYGAAEYDLTKGVDFTGRSNLTAALINQLVDNGVIKSGKGGIIFKATAPDVENNLRYTNFLWLDGSTTPPILKQWIKGVKTADWNYSTNWAVISAPASVTSNMMAASSIGPNALASNAVHEWHIDNNAVTGLKIQDLAVNTAKLATNAVTTGNIIDGAVTSAKLATNAVQAYHLSAGSVGPNAIAVNAINSPTLISNRVITDANIAFQGLTGTNVLVPRSVYGTNIALATVANDNIGLQAVRSNSIALNVVAAPHMDALNLTNSSWPPLIGWGYVTEGGTLIRGYNISGITKVGTGMYFVELVTNFFYTIGTNFIFYGNVVAHDTDTDIITTCISSNSTSTNFTIRVGANGANYDRTFSFVVF